MKFSRITAKLKAIFQEETELTVECDHNQIIDHFRFLGTAGIMAGVTPHAPQMQNMHTEHPYILPQMNIYCRSNQNEPVITQGPC